MIILYHNCGEYLTYCLLAFTLYFDALLLRMYLGSLLSRLFKFIHVCDCDWSSDGPVACASRPRWATTF